MDVSETRLDNTEVQSFSQSGGDGATPPMEDTQSVPEFLIFSDLYNHPDESIAMNWEIFCAVQAGNINSWEMMKRYKTPMACFKNDKGDSILHVAHAGHSEVVKVLASVAYFPARLSGDDRGGLNVCVRKDENGDTAMHLALKSLHEKTKRLRRNSISLHDASPELIKTVVFLVNANRHASFLSNYDGLSPLYMAVESGNLSLVNAMLNRHCNDIQSRTFNLASQLEGRKFACTRSSKGKKYRSAFTSNVSDFMLSEPNSNSSLVWADVLGVIFSEDPSLVNEKDEEGQTCISVGASVGYYEGVCYILDRSIEANYVRDREGYFPIHMAAKYGHVKVLEVILKRYPDALELPGKHGQNILHVAAGNGQLKAVKFLLRFYKDGNERNSINEQDADGNTPLHMATNNAHAKVVSVLTWDDRVEVNTLNSTGLTALDTVIKNIGRSCGIWELLTWVPLVSASAPRDSKIKIPGLDGGANKDEVTTFLLVSTLVATMTFTAGFALPGGYNGSVPHLGMAALAKKPAFQVFLVFDTLAMYCSLITTVTLIWAQLSHQSIIIKSFRLALPLLAISLTFMSIAFMAGTYAAVSHLPLFAYFLLGIGLFFLLVLLMIIVPYVYPKACTNPFLRHIFYFPNLVLLWAAGDSRSND